MKLLEFPKREERNIQEALNALDDQKEEFVCLIALAITKKGEPFILHSPMNGPERAFLLAFAQSTLTRDFLVMEIRPPEAPQE